jgi:hypothetical protein
VTDSLQAELAALEECLKSGRLSRTQRSILMRIITQKGNSASLRRQIKSAKAFRDARWIAIAFYFLEAENPDALQKVIISDVMKACHFKRSYVYKAKRWLERTHPEVARSFKNDAAMSNMVFGPRSVLKRIRPLK